VKLVKDEIRVVYRKEHIGGIEMMKMKLLTTVLIVLVAVGASMAADVINVDIKGYGSNQPYVGNGAYDVGPNTVWTVYYGGFGVPVGSARSEGLAAADQPFFCSVYAAQVWIGDDGLNHNYQYGTGLMNDGFAATDPCTAEPKLAIYGQGAYQGVYDIYVYGRDAGDFRLTRYGVTESKGVTGGVAAGTFVEGGNYVVFSNVDVNNANSNDLYISYTNKLNALQFVKKKNPVAVTDGTIIWAGKWDVAGERNIRSDDVDGFAPDTFGAEPNITVGRLETGEFMGYDITVDDANQGRYLVYMDVNTNGSYRINPLRIYLDDKFVGDVCDMNLAPPEGKTTDASVNLFKGSHTIKWYMPYQGFGSSTGSNFYYLKFVRIGSVTMKNCDEVGLYGYSYPEDLTGNCIVDLQDLDAMVDNWLICNDPDPTKCF
jgi:hypothetical protein